MHAVIAFISDSIDQKNRENQLYPKENLGFMVPVGDWFFITPQNRRESRKLFVHCCSIWADLSSICMEATEGRKTLGKDLDAAYTIQLVNSWIPLYWL